MWIRESVGAVGPSAWPVGLRGPALTWVGACTSLAWAPPAGPKWAVPLGTPHRAPHFPHLGAKEAAPVSGCSWRVPVCPGGSCDLPWGPKPHSWHLPLDPVAELLRSSVCRGLGSGPLPSDLVPAPGWCECVSVRSAFVARLNKGDFNTLPEASLVPPPLPLPGPWAQLQPACPWVGRAVGESRGAFQRVWDLWLEQSRLSAGARGQVECPTPLSSF